MTSVPAIDYTNKDFAALRQAMLELKRYRLPEHNDDSPGDVVSLLFDAFAYMGDLILYYQDRIANELFLATATERRSVLDLLRLIGYELRPPVAASADLTLIFNVPGPGESTPTTIPNGAQFTSQGAATQTFEYLGPDLALDLATSQVEPAPDGKLVYRGLPVRHSRAVATETLGSSTGEPNQSFPLTQSPLIPGSLVVEVNEGASWAEWNQREHLLYHLDPRGRVVVSGPDSTDYYVQYDEMGAARVNFGDGTYGRIPAIGANNLRARYRVGGGTVGNVPAGSIVDAVTSIDRFHSAFNPNPAAGGEDQESVDHAKSFAPLAFRSGGRAVTLADIVALTHLAGGVAKVFARARGWNQIDLFVAPEGETCRPVPDDLRTRLQAYFEDKRMVTTLIEMHDPVCAPIEVSLSVVAAHHANPEAVQLDVEQTVRQLLAFRNMDFGQALYLSKIYEAVESIPGVHAVAVTRFRRQGETPEAVQQILEAFGVSSVDDLPEVVRHSVDVNLAPDGRIDLDEIEIPVLAELQVSMDEVAP